MSRADAEWTVPADGESWRHDTVETNGVVLHAVTAGPEDGDLVVLLHGFPDFWYTWRHQLPALAEAGYRVVAPDMRGYNCSEKPSGVDAYHIDELVGDVVGLVRAFDRESAHLVGHDWGGLVAWYTAGRRPGVVDRLAVLNAPHPSAYERALRTSPAQLRKSWYVGSFQLPWLPEYGLAWNDYAVVERLFTEETVAPVSDRDIEYHKRALARPGARRAALHYYRSMARRTARQLLTRRGVGDLQVRVPTLLLWGLRDAALDRSLTQGLETWVPDIEVERYADAGHWVQFDAADRVTDRLRTHLDSE